MKFKLNIWTYFISVTVVTSTLYVLLLNVFSREILIRRTDARSEKILNRTEVLNRMCKESDYEELQDNYIKMFKNIIVNDKYKVMFCYVPKVACTNFLRLMLWLNGKSDMANSPSIKSANVHILKRNLTSLGTFSPSEIRYRLKNYRKAIFVRDPLVRLISAFRNKFQSNNSYFMSRYGNQIIQKYRNSSFHYNQKNVKIKFSEFLRYLVDETTIKKGYEDHWKSFNDLCHPCLIRYNFIGKYESIEQDVEELLKLLDIQGQFKFPKRDEHYKHALSADLLSSSFRNVEPAIFKRIVKIYSNDYAVFNYNKPSLFKIINM